MGCHFLLQCMKVKSESEVAQLYLTLQPHGLQPTRLRPWDFPGRSTGVGYHCLLRKKAERRIDAFELWCWRRLLWVLWIARSSQSILRKFRISNEYSLEGLMLKLKLQYFGHLMQRTDTSEKALMLGKIEDRRRRGRQRMIWLDGITNSMNVSLSNDGDGQGGLACYSPWVAKSWIRLSNWTDLMPFNT